MTDKVVGLCLSRQNKTCNLRKYLCDGNRFVLLVAVVIEIPIVIFIPLIITLSATGIDLKNLERRH